MILSNFNVVKCKTKRSGTNDTIILYQKESKTDENN